ncbi:hypothetical protein [Sphingomonas sp. RB1R13]|uniref:hypothetical protein n=1 Tax=Sphingomonas sp. RB1R13 TaxID=3096159 RepID=UPI002FCC0C4C
MYKYALVLALVFASSLAASTPESWKQLDRKSGRTCIAISGLARPELLAFKNSFSDVIGIDLRMIRGRDAKGHMKRLLCAYNRSSGRAEIQDGKNWLGPTVQP